MIQDKINILGSLMGGPADQSAFMGQLDAENQVPRQPQEAAANRRAGGRYSPGPLPASASGRSSASRGQHKLNKRFSVLKKLGKGTYGKVQLAINKETGQEVAIKTIKKSKIETNQDLERVRREIQIMSSIEHPHIIHIYEVFENKDKIVLVMQYAPGGELYEYVSQCKLLDDREARRLFRQIATAIFYCHQNKICHRDLKLENILLDEKNNAKLADFGLSNVFDKRRQLSTFCGSPLYVSPEIVQGLPYEGPEVDCWSLGVLLFTLVYGAMPFDGSNFKRLVKQISEANYFEPKQRSHASGLIRRLLCADPRGRATIMDICTDSWVNGIYSPLNNLGIPVGHPNGAGNDSPQAQQEVPRSPLNSLLSSQQQQQQQQQWPYDGQASCSPTSPSQLPRNSLLQVAQDMAKLSPVRFDILKALLPPEPALTSSCEEEAINRKPELVAEPTQASYEPTPMATYIVRDLEPATTTEAPKDQEPKGEQPEQLVEMDHTQIQLDGSEPEPDKEVQMDVGEVELSADLDESNRTELPEAEDGQITSLPCDSLAESHKEPEPETAPPTEMPMHDQQPLEEVKPDMELDPKQDQELEEHKEEEEQAVPDHEPEIAQVQIEDKRIGELVEEDPKEQHDKQAPQLLDVPLDTLATTDEGSTGQVSPAPDSTGSGKPKKVVKKKIVLVKKKKKKASSKDNDTQQAPVEDQQVTDANSLSEPEAVKELTRKAAQEDTSSTVMSTQEAPPESVSQIQSESARAKRRRSTLIADMSEKLMQQLAADGSVPSPSESFRQEQATLLAQVNVNEKKEDYERRASLMLQPEMLELDHCRRPSFDRSLDQQEDDDDDQLQAASRSDSAETLKPSGVCVSSPVICEHEPPSPDVKTTHLEINLMDKEDLSIGQPTDEPDVEKSSASEPSASLEPVPITRSYKKVTFTKDGACITETAKVYAHKGDDGTVRRVERKSKVTHYPASKVELDARNAKRQTKTTYSESSEEISFSSTSGGLGMAPSGLNWTSRRPQLDDFPFERLVTPFANLDHPRVSGDLEEIQQQQQQDRSPARDRDELLRSGSASSCSSGSTDILDDIFDNWTGAMSNFGLPIKARLGSFGRQSPSIFGHHHHHKKHHRRRQQGASEMGSARCESADPHAKVPGVANVDQYGQSRPASAMGSGWTGMRHLGCGSRSNLFFSQQPGVDGLARPRPELDEDPTQALMREISLKHSKLEEQLARHKRLWSGSTPSLFDEEDQLTGRVNRASFMEQDESTRSMGIKTAQPEEKARPMPPRPPVSPHRASGTRLVSVLSETASPLDSRPVRRNTANLSHLIVSSNSMLSSGSLMDDQLGQEAEMDPILADMVQVHRSLSRASIISDRLSQMHIADYGKPNQTQEPGSAFDGSTLKHGPPSASVQPKRQVASFIELKRTSSSSLGPRSTLLEHQQVTREQRQQRKEVVTKTTTTSTITTKSSRRLISGSDTGDSYQPATPEQAVMEETRVLRKATQTGGPGQAENADTRIQSWLQESSSNFSSSSGSKSSASFATSDPAALRNDPSFGNLYHQQQQQPQVGQSAATQLPPMIPRSLMQRRHQQDTSGHQQADDGKQQQQKQECTPGSESSTITRTSFTIQMKGPADQCVSSRKVSPTDDRSSSPTDEFPVLAELGGSFADSQSMSTNTSSSLLDHLKSRGYRALINQKLMMAEQANPGSSNSLSVDQAPSSSLSSHSSGSAMATSATDQPIRQEVRRNSSHKPNPDLESQYSREITSQTDADMASAKVIENGQSGDTGNHQNGTCSVELKPANGTPRDGDEPELPAEDSDDDEQLKKSKANVRSYRDRVRETESFLKSLEAADQDAQREREQLFLLNQVMLRNKITGLTGLQFTDSRSLCPAGDHARPLGGISHSQAGFSTAPVQSSWRDNNEHPLANGFLSSSSMTTPSFGPTMMSNVNYSTDHHFVSFQETEGFSNGLNYHKLRQKPQHQIRPLSPEMNTSSRLMGYTRARSIPPEESSVFKEHDEITNQDDITTDDGSSYRYATRDRLPGSFRMPTTNWSLDSMGARSRRSQSEARQLPTRRSGLSSPPNPTQLGFRSSNLKLDLSSERSTYMTEYQRAFGATAPSRLDDSPDSIDVSYRPRFARSSWRSTENEPDETHRPSKWSNRSSYSSTNERLFGISPTTTNVLLSDAAIEPETEASIEDSMESYRPRAYVPKVVPTEPRHSRSYKRRSLTGSSDWNFTGSKQESASPIRATASIDAHRTKPYQSDRRSSIQIGDLAKQRCQSISRDNDDPSSTDQTNGSSIEYRQQDMGLGRMSAAQSESRLSELEQRLEANRKRREELLAASRQNMTSELIKTTTPTRARSVARDYDVPTTASKAQPTGQPTSGSSRLVARPSRLESMEARIKRRSYCVRVEGQSGDQNGQDISDRWSMIDSQTKSQI